MIIFKFKTFNELTNTQLYEILALRSEVFVVEQNCLYHDPDGKDLDAMHLLGVENNKLVAYLRLFLPNKELNPVIFGRVVTSKLARGKGYGKQLLQEMLNYCEKNFRSHDIHCFAQLYLKAFYKSFGFNAAGDVYDDAGISHIKMIKSSP